LLRSQKVVGRYRSLIQKIDVYIFEGKRLSGKSNVSPHPAELGREYGASYM
jgi:hypothetical protein